MINQGFKDISIANVNKEVRGFGQPFRYFRLISAPVGADVSLSTVQDGNKSDFFIIEVGDVFLFGDSTNDCFFKSSVAGQIVYQWSLTDSFRTANIINFSSPPGVTILGPLNSAGEVLTGGPQAIGHTGPDADYNNPNIVGIVDKAGTLFKLGGDAQGQYTQNLNSNDGFLHSATDSLVTLGEKVLIISIASGHFTPLVFTDAFGNFLPIFTTDGRFISLGNLVLDTAPGNIYAIPCGGTVTVNSAGNVAWTYRVGRSFSNSLLASPARLSRQFQTVIFASGGLNTIIPAVAGKRVYVYGYKFSLGNGGFDFTIADTVGNGLSATWFNETEGQENSESPLFFTNVGAGIAYNWTLLGFGNTSSLQLRYEQE